MKTTMQLALAMGLALILGGSRAWAADNGNNGNGNNTTTTTQPFTQLSGGNPLTTINNNNSINIGFNGVPSTTDGVNHNADGTIAYVDPVAANGTITYSQWQPDGPNGVTYQKEMLTTVDSNGVSVTKWDGIVYRQDTVSGSTKWVQIVPAISMTGLNSSQVTGVQTNNPPTMGVLVDGTHNDNQTQGGVLNTQPQRADSLEGLVKAVKESATTIIDMSSNNYTMTGQGLGTVNNPAIVYASGKVVNGVMTETDLRFSGQENGYGILVVEIDDPNKAQFNMSGQSMWHGLIVVAINKVPTSNKQPLSFVGGGQEIHVIGGVFVYMRNLKRTPSETATLLGQELVKLAGNGNITFSDQAIEKSFQLRPTAMQVRSWRRLQENE